MSSKLYEVEETIRGIRADERELAALKRALDSYASEEADVLPNYIHIASHETASHILEILKEDLSIRITSQKDKLRNLLKELNNENQ